MKHWKPFAALLATVALILIAPLAMADKAPTTAHITFGACEAPEVLATPVPQDVRDLFTTVGPTRAASEETPRFLSNCPPCEAQLDRCIDECVFTPGCGTEGIDACNDQYDDCYAQYCA